MASSADYLTCLDCGHEYKAHTTDGNCSIEGCECFGYMWPDDDE